MSTAVDTSGQATLSALEKVIPFTDIFLYDIKAVSESVHERCTAVSNKRILENLKYLSERGCAVEVRIPYVPGYNSGEISAIADLLAEIKTLTKVRVLPYHSYASSKYSALGMEHSLPESLPTEQELEAARAILRSRGINVME